MSLYTIDMYAHNRGTRQYATSYSVADLGAPVPRACPFCTKPTTMIDGRMAEHREACGITRCPASGCSPITARQLAAKLTADYTLPGEALYD